jgi:curli biogenesis system outer membrane secretion channel CsgG
MIDLSLPGLIGAMVGTAVAAMLYTPLVSLVERGLRTHEREDVEALEREISILRRAVLAADIIMLGGIGYWLGERIAG